MAEHRSIRDPLTGQSVDARVAMQSYLEPWYWLTAQQRAARIRACEDAALLAAVDAFGNQEYVIRGLEESDFNVTTTKDWIETTEGAGAYASAAFATGAANIFDNLIIGIYGARILAMENEAGVSAYGEIGAVAAPVTALRITVGGKRMAEWDLMVLMRLVGTTATTATGDAAVLGAQPDFPDGFARTPVVITKEKAVDIEFWEGTTTLEFAVALLGIVVEPVGGGQMALSP